MKQACRFGHIPCHWTYFGVAAGKKTFDMSHALHSAPAPSDTGQGKRKLAPGSGSDIRGFWAGMGPPPHLLPSPRLPQRPSLSPMGPIPSLRAS
jgi:hypothetical protein